MRAPLLAIAAGLVAMTSAVVVAVSLHGADRSDAAPQRVPVVDRGTLPRPQAPGPSTQTSTSGSGTPGDHVVTAGSRLHLARLGIDAPVVPVRVLAHVMQIPLDPHTLGWWRDGAGPGDAHGSVVIVGHINYAGTTGALSVLPDAQPGDTVTLSHRTYRIAAVRTYPKTSGIPMSAFRTTGSPQLVLITCGGPFDASTGNYEDNIVAYAAPA